MTVDIRNNDKTFNANKWIACSNIFGDLLEKDLFILKSFKKCYMTYLAQPFRFFKRAQKLALVAIRTWTTNF